MTGRLDGKVALITGAARGQGAAAARAFVAEGAKVVIADVLDDEGKQLADELCREGHLQGVERPEGGLHGPPAVYQHLDVSDEDAWTQAVERTLEQFGKLNVLVNNAGVLHFSLIEDTKLADYQRVIAVNQIGTFLGMRAVVKPMREAGGGSIVNVSSVDGLGSQPLMAVYTSTKFAIRGMTKSAALELGKDGIRVNSVHPGMIDTKMVSDAAGGIDVDTSPFGKKVALRRVGRPEEIANLVLFLASDESSYSTGSEFVADGGATAQHALRVQ